MRTTFIRGIAAALLCGGVCAAGDGGAGRIEISEAECAGESVRLAVTCPGGFTNRLDVYVCTNLFEGKWRLADTNLAPAVDGPMNWHGSLPQDGRMEFYMIGNADLDSDGDGLADAREKLIYGSNRSMADTDSDGLPDGWEMRYFGNTTNAAAGADDDGDGWNNGIECRRGGHPLAAWIEDANNILKLEVLTPLRK